MEKRLKEDIVRASASVRQKYNALRRGIAADEEEAGKRFGTILKPLNTLVELSEKGDAKPKSEDFNVPTVDFPKVDKKFKSKIKTKFPRKKKTRKPPIPLFEAAPEEVFESGVGDVSFFEDEEDRDFQDKISDFGPLTREYLTGLEKDNRIPYKQRRFDQTFGVRISGEGKWSIGNKEVDFDREDKIHLGESAWWTGTRGLFELLFKKLPNMYSRNDLAKYKEILEWSSAHLHNYDPTGRISSSWGHKYRQVIGPLFRGSGLLPVTDNRIDYIRWDDPNELVQRLALLLASREAGNGGHEAEIASIEEELREGQYIQ